MALMLCQMPTGRGWKPFKYWHIPLICSGAEMHNLPEYLELQNCAHENQRLANLAGKMVGNGDLSVQWDESSYLDAVLFDLPIQELSPSDPQPMVDQQFDAVYSNFEDEIYSDRMTVEVIAPVHGLTLDNPVRLQESLTIERFNADEVAHTPFRFPSQGPLRLTPQATIRLRFTTPKTIGQVDPRQQRQNTAQLSAATGIVESVLIALAAFKRGSFSAEYILAHSRSAPGLIQMSYNPINPTPRSSTDNYRLEQREYDNLIGFWQTYDAAQKRKIPVLDTALRRFAFANGRTAPADRIVDLVIASESLLLSGVGDPQYRAEIKYRFSTNAALALPSNKWQTFSLFKTAYDLRSSIAHGSTPKNEVKLPNDEKVTVTAFSDIFQEELRKVLHDAIRRAANDNTPKDQLFPWGQLLKDLFDE